MQAQWDIAQAKRKFKAASVKPIPRVEVEEEALA